MICQTYVRLTPELAAEVQARGFDSLEQMVYSETNLAQPIDKFKSLFDYRGISCMCFESADCKSYYATSPAHSTLAAKSDFPDFAIKQLELAIDKLLSLRQLSKYESKINAAVQRSAMAILKTKAKSSVMAMGKTLVSIYGKDKIDSCYYVAARLAASCEDIAQSERDWAEDYKLKFFVVGCRIEEAIDSVLSR